MFDAEPDAPVRCCSGEVPLRLLMNHRAPEQVRCDVKHWRSARKRKFPTSLYTANRPLRIMEVCAGTIPRCYSLNCGPSTSYAGNVEFYPRSVMSGVCTVDRIDGLRGDASHPEVIFFKNFRRIFHARAGETGSPLLQAKHAKSDVRTLHLPIDALKSSRRIQPAKWCPSA